MKGTSTVIISKDELVNIVQKWWDDMTYQHKTRDEVRHVTQKPDGDVEIYMQEKEDEPQ